MTMNAYSVSDVAAELGIDPRALRRFLRSDPSYRNAGMGGRYIFSQAEMTSLKRAYLHGKPKSQREVTTEDPRILDDDPGVPVSELTPRGLTPSLRAQRQAARAQRQQRLRQRMGEVLTPRYDNEPVSD